jgi:predicted nucleotidyltransferase
VGRHLLDGVDVPVVDVSDLIVMKVLAGRPKDVEDVVTLLRVQEASVELTRVRRTLQMLESALAQSDLMPALDQALARARARSGGR